MSDTTIKKVQSKHSPKGEMGQKYLVAGKQLSMRLWEESPKDKRPADQSSRQYETIGFMISGKAELTLEGQKIVLDEGDSWLVPAGAAHSYKILEPLVAIEATAPPAEMHGRD